MTSFVPYVVPFIVFAGFTYLVPLFHLSPAWIYPVKTIIVAILLALFWSRIKDQIRFSFDLSAVAGGIAVFILWIGLENLYPQIGSPTRFNPHELARGNTVYLIMGFRVLGAALVVPVMEELFWRSFALRFLIDTTFTRVAPGTFTWFSFVVGSIAFGFEHQRWLPGILAGMIYAMLWYRKKNLFAPILAHGITNLLLGIYVISTNAWEYW
jgi:uncharacterized protein